MAQRPTPTTELHDIVASLDKDVSVLKSGFASLVEGQKALSANLKEGIDSLTRAIAEVANSAPRMSMNTLYPFIGMTAMGIGAFWVVVNLLVAPIGTALEKHITQTEPIGAIVSRLEFEAQENKRDIRDNAQRSDLNSEQRNHEQQIHIDALKSAVEGIMQRQMGLLEDVATLKSKP